jgi:hypothetical protein
MKTKKIVILILTVLILGIFIMNLIYKPSTSDLYQVTSMIIDNEANVMDDARTSVLFTKTGFRLFSEEYDDTAEFKYLTEEVMEYLVRWVGIEDNLFFGRRIKLEKEGMYGKNTRFKVKYKDGVWPFNSDRLKIQILNFGSEVIMEINCIKR